jgi:hypothetical protein
MNTDNEFDKIINRLTEGGPTVKPQSKLSSLFGVVMGASIISGIGAVLLMLINNILISAFPNLIFFRPGLGFLNGYKLFFLILVLKMIFTAISNAQKNS